MSHNQWFEYVMSVVLLLTTAKCFFTTYLHLVGKVLHIHKKFEGFMLYVVVFI